MLDRRDSRDFLDAFETAMAEFAKTDNEIIVIDSKEKDEMVNAVILVRGKGITKSVVTMYHNFIKKLDKAKNKEG